VVFSYRSPNARFRTVTIAVIEVFVQLVAVWKNKLKVPPLKLLHICNKVPEVKPLRIDMDTFGSIPLIVFPLLIVTSIKHLSPGVV
jgi:hypothetical protein